MGDKTSTIVFQPVAGLVMRGPYLCGKNYTVPDDVADHLVAAGAERVKLGEKEQPTPLGPEHREHFASTRALIEANSKRAAADKPAAATSEAAPPPPAAPKSN